MQAKKEIIETLNLLDEESILKLYDLALNFRYKKKSDIIKRSNLANIQRSQKILSSIK